MDSYYRNQINIFSLKDLVIELASRWKLVLICMIIGSVILAGSRYLLAMKAYNNAVAEQNEVQAETDEKDPNKEIAEILNTLGGSDLNAVKETLYLSKLIASQRDYFDNSLLMGVDPENETVISSLYAVKNHDEKGSAIINGYKELLLSEEIIESIKADSAITAENEYVRELISFDNIVKTADDIKVSVDTNEGDTLNITVIVPEGIDAEQIYSGLSKAMSKCRKKLIKNVGDHELEELSSETRQICDRNTLQRQQIIIKDLLDNKNLLITQERSLTEAQRAAYTNISALQSGAQAPVQAVQVQKPGLSKKSLLYGAVGGLLLFIFVFILQFLFRGRINTPDDAVSATDGRLIGQIYRKSNSPLRWLLSSDLVNRIRYKSMTDPVIQTDKAISTIDAICRHAGAKNVALAAFSMDDSEDGDIIKKIAAVIGEKGINATAIEPSDNEKFDENDMNDIDSAVIILKGEKAQKRSISDWLELCKYYNVNNLGTVYVKEI